MPSISATMRRVRHANRGSRTSKKPPSHPSGAGGPEIMIRGHLAYSGDGDGAYRRADGGGYVG